MLYVVIFVSTIVTTVNYMRACTFSFKLTILLWADLILQLYLPYLKVCVWLLKNNAVLVKGKCLFNQMMLCIICILFIMSYPELSVSYPLLLLISKNKYSSKPYIIITSHVIYHI